jgi:cell division transport system permease protein
MNSSQLNPLSHWLVSHLRAFLFALGELVRNPMASLLTIMVIGVAMALPTLLAILQLNAKTMTLNWNQDPNIAIYLKKSTKEDEISSMLRTLKSNTHVAKIKYISPEQGLQEFSKAIQMENFMSQFNENPLPPVLVIIPKKNNLTPASLEKLATEFQSYPDVDSVQLDIDWIKRFNLILSLINRFTYFLSLTLGAAVLLIIGNTIRLTTQTHRQEIALLKLIGASGAFIQRPLLYRGLLYGLLGGIMAWLFVLLLLWNIEPSLRTLLASYQATFVLRGEDLQTGLCVIAICGALGFAGAWVAARRYLLAEP